MIASDDTLLTSPLGPEFSVRIINSCKNNNVTTVGELREQLPHIHKWRGLGAKSLQEIRAYYKQGSELFNSREYSAYMLETSLSSAEALLHEVQRSLTKIAIRGSTTTPTKSRLQELLQDAQEHINRLPSPID